MKLRVIVVGILLLLGVISHAEQKNEIKFSGTATSKRGTFAMINGKPYYEGEILCGSKIVAISKEKITLVQSGRTNYLYSSRLAKNLKENKDSSLMGSMRSFFSSKESAKGDGKNQNSSHLSPGERNKKIKQLFFEQRNKNILFFVSFMIGWLICFVATVWFLIQAFKQNILWGLGCLFLPLVGFIFLFVHWQEAKKPFLLYLFGFGLLIAIAFTIGSGFFDQVQNL